MCREGQVCFEELAHAVVGMVCSKSAGRAGRPETREELAYLTGGRAASSSGTSVFFLKALTCWAEAHRHQRRRSALLRVY